MKRALPLLFILLLCLSLPVHAGPCADNGACATASRAACETSPDFVLWWSFYMDGACSYACDVLNTDGTITTRYHHFWCASGISTLDSAHTCETPMHWDDTVHMCCGIVNGGIWCQYETNGGEN